MRDVKIKAEWFKGLEDAPIDVIKELAGRIILYGCFEKDVDDFEEDSWGIKSNWNNIKGNITRMQSAYEHCQELGKTFGRKARITEEELYGYIKDHPGSKPADIGMALGKEPGESKKGPYAYIYDMKAWLKRKEIWSGKITSLEEIFSEKIPKSEKNSANGIPISEKISENAENLNTFPEKEISSPNFFDDRF